MVSKGKEGSPDVQSAGGCRKRVQIIDSGRICTLTDARIFFYINTLET